MQMGKAFLWGLLFSWVAVVPLARGGPQSARPDLKRLFEDAQHALLVHDYPKAEEGFQEVLRIDPHSVGAMSNLGVIYLRTGRYDAAIQVFQQARDLAPQMIGINLNLGLAYYRKQNFAKAIPCFTRVVRHEPEHRQARYLLGVSYFMLDDYEHVVATLTPLANEE